MGPAREEKVRELLTEFAPDVNTWLELDLPQHFFKRWESHEVLSTAHELVDTIPALRGIVDGLDKARVPSRLPNDHSDHSFVACLAAGDSK